MFVKLIYRHFVFKQDKYQVCKFRIYRHFIKSVNGSSFPVFVPNRPRYTPINYNKCILKQ